MTADIEALKRRLEGKIALYKAHSDMHVLLSLVDAERILAALERIPELERRIQDKNFELTGVHKALREMTSSYHTVCVQVAAFEEAAEKVAHAPRAGRDVAIGVLRRVLEGYVGTRISVEEDELERLLRVEAALKSADQQLRASGFYIYADLIQAELRAALALAPAEEGKG